MPMLFEYSNLRVANRRGKWDMKPSKGKKKKSKFRCKVVHKQFGYTVLRKP